MNEAPTPRYTTGQMVRVVTCPQQNSEHTGRVGYVTTGRRTTGGMVRVQLEAGICQAAAVEPVEMPHAGDPTRPESRYQWNSKRLRRL